YFAAEAGSARSAGRARGSAGLTGVAAGLAASTAAARLATPADFAEGKAAAERAPAEVAPVATSWFPGSSARRGHREHRGRVAGGLLAPVGRISAPVGPRIPVEADPAPYRFLTGRPGRARQHL